MNNKETPGIVSRILDTLIGIGLGESLLRAGTMILSIVLIGSVVWLVRLFYLQGPTAGSGVNALETEPTAVVARIDDVPQNIVDSFGGVPRLAQVHTTIPSRPRQEIVKYTVQEGDTVFGIAENFGLKPETILWGNY